MLKQNATINVKKCLRLFIQQNRILNIRKKTFQANCSMPKGQRLNTITENRSLDTGLPTVVAAAETVAVSPPDNWKKTVTMRIWLLQGCIYYKYYGE